MRQSFGHRGWSSLGEKQSLHHGGGGMVEAIGTTNPVGQGGLRAGSVYRTPIVGFGSYT
jgi:hypothetical protein